MRRLLLISLLAMLLFCGCDETSRDTLRGLNAMRKGDHAGAVEAYTRVLDREGALSDSVWVLTCIMRGNIYKDWFQQAGDSTHLNLAIADLDTALSRDPTNIHGLLIRFLTLRLADRPEDAFRDAHRLWELEPDHADYAWYAAGELSRLERREEAIAFLDSALISHPNEPKLIYSKATQLVLLRRAKEAIPLISQLIALEPEEADHFRLRSLAYRLDGNLEAAIQDMDQAIELEDSVYYNYMTRSSLYRMLGDTVHARTDSLMAISLQTQS